MIVIPDRKAVIITPPKCGSTTAHEMFFPYGYRVDGPQFENFDDIGKHTTSLTYGTNKYKVFCLIRNPADRFRSLYNHYVREQAFVLPELYVDWYQNFYPFYSWTIKKIVSKFSRVEWIRLEHIIDDTWHKLGLKVEPIRLNANKESLTYLDIECPDSFDDLPSFTDDPYPNDEHHQSDQSEHTDDQATSGENFLPS